MAEIDEGSVIGNYRVIRLLGQGGMGTVYEVEHLELGTHYALKTFTFDPDNAANHALKKKFLEEGKLLARLKHPNLTHVFDLGFEDETQMPYFVMDLVTYEDGETYTVEDIDLKDIDEDMVYGWFKQLASALDYIHGEGIVHRDIKPSNLLVDKDLNVVLTDFGISRIFGQKIKSEVEATRTMVSKTGRGKLVLGTEHYIAPEVADGEEATPKADAYSLGVMLLRWLTGFYYGDNPGAVALLSRKKYQWVGVISQLLAPASRRPEKYSELVRQLKPAPKPAPAAKPQQGKKKRSRTKENIIIAAAALLAVGVLGVGGYGVWRYVENRNAERDRQVAALAQQIREKEVADRKAKEEAEAAKKAKEAEEKKERERKAREAKLAEQKRIEESRTKIEKQDVSQLAVRETPAPEVKKETQEPEPEKPKEEFVVIKEETPAEEVKDYGPIPDKKYAWLKGGNSKLPQPINFYLANGAVIDLLPLSPGIFYMSNTEDSEEPDCHKVVLTYPFWMSKFNVTAKQWREFAPNDCDDCKDIELAVGTDFPVSKKYPRKSVDAYCKYLTEKYRQQIPSGYVFRLPSEAEWEYAMDISNTQRMYEKFAVPHVRSWADSVSCEGQDCKAKWDELVKTKRLTSVCAWEKDWCIRGWTADHRFFVGGKQQPMASGVCDMLTTRWNDIGLNMTLDVYKSGTNIRYSATEVDPLHWYVNANDHDTYDVMWRKSFFERRLRNINEPGVFHVVLGPDLIMQKAWENERRDWDAAATPKAKMSKMNLDPMKVPTKISKGKEVRMKMVCGEDMIFCTVPAVRKFNMSNCDGQEKQYHTVSLAKPFWMTKFPVTLKQWREFGPYDEDSNARVIEKAFPKLKICQSFNYYKLTAFCNFLTERYKSVLPDGYVFRLPTEAEWEWALLADDKAYARDADVNSRNTTSGRYRDEFMKMLKKQRPLSGLSFTQEGWCDRIYVAGRTEPNKFGICDMLHPWEEYVFDCYTSDDLGEWSGSVGRNVFYKDGEIDPVHWDGILMNKVLMRGSRGQGRRLGDRTGNLLAHIVIAPDIEKELKRKEMEDYPQEDFSGEFLGGMAKVYKMSSNALMGGMGGENALRRMLALENVRVAFMTNKDRECGWISKEESAPWIQIELEKKMQITGIQLENYWWQERCRALRVWVSDDGKHEREVFKEERGIALYRIDLHDKNIKAKYVRIGREPGASTIDFRLNKILIYGKK